MNFRKITETKIELKAGDFPIKTVPVVIASGSGVVAANTVLGKITASGKYQAYDNANADGSETAALILTHEVDATSTDVNASAYRTGDFNRAALIGIDDSAVTDLDAKCIFVSKVY